MLRWSSVSQCLEPSQGAKSLNLRFSLYGKAVCTVQMGKSRWGEGRLPTLPGTLASGKGVQSWMCKAVIACGLRHPGTWGFRWRQNVLSQLSNLQRGGNGCGQPDPAIEIGPVWLRW